MKPKKKLLKGSSLYLILDKQACATQSLLEIAAQAGDAGVDMIQLRDKHSPKETILKTAYSIRKILAHKKTILIINDYPDIAKIIDSDGVHLGQNDFSVPIARRILGQDKIIGVSCRNVAQARLAQKQGADYIGVGPIFATPTKPQAMPVGLNLIRKIRDSVSIPFFAIGDINQENLKEVLAAGAERIAVCRAVCAAKNIPASVKQLLRSLN